MRTIYQSVKQKVNIIWLGLSSFIFGLILRVQHNATGPHGYPDAPWHNAVLKREKEVSSSIEQVRKLGLPVREDPPKNWDTLAALDLILKSTGKNAHIFDAGGELYSMILPWLFLYGYRNLSAGNKVFKKTIKKGPIVYRNSNITQTGFDPAAYDVITCLSVIEHGVDIRAYFCEMARLLKLGGILITSTDYFETQIDTGGKMAYGVPVHIFTREEIVEILEIASQLGLILTSPLDLSVDEKVVKWYWPPDGIDFKYTFIIFSLQKVANV